MQPRSRRRVVECAAPQLCAKRAGMGFLADVEHDVPDVGLDKVERHADGLRKFGDGREVLTADAEIEHHTAKFKGRAAKPLVQLEAIEQEQAILPAGYAHADLVAGADHAVALVRAADAP